MRWRSTRRDSCAWVDISALIACAAQAAWVRGESPERRKKADSSDDDVRAAACCAARGAGAAPRFCFEPSAFAPLWQDYAPSGAQAKRRKAPKAPKPGARRRAGCSVALSTAPQALSRHRAAPAPKAPKAPKAPAAAAKPRSAGGEARGITLADLIRAKALRPGPNALTTLYKGTTYAADLGPSGAWRVPANG
jgi:hypothetical protein